MALNAVFEQEDTPPIAAAVKQVLAERGARTELERDGDDDVRVLVTIE